MCKCKFCGAPEVEAMTPRTVYDCGSSSYDERPDTWKRSAKCKTYIIDNRVEQTWNTIKDLKELGIDPDEYVENVLNEVDELLEELED